MIELEPAQVPAVVATVTRLKTGMLCRLAAELGAIAAGATPATRKAIADFAEDMGRGLQMLDDLGSLTDPARRPKAHEDLRALRPTWPWAWLAEGDAALWLHCTALARIAKLDELAAALVRATATRGRAQIRTTLEGALAALRAAVGACPTVDAIAAELARMEVSYG